MLNNAAPLTHILVTTALWKSRSETLHSATKIATEVSIKMVIDLEIVKLHWDRAQIPASDRHYCNI